MSDSVITPYGRASFVALKAPHGSKQKPDDKKYSVSILLPPAADLAALKKLASDTVKAKWGAELPKKLKSPVLDAFTVSEEADKGPYAGYDKGWTLIRVSTKLMPGFADQRGVGILPSSARFDELFYSGAWIRAEVNAFAYDVDGNRGVSFGLQNVQFIKHDEQLGGRRPVEKVFGAIEDAEALPEGDADSIF